MDGGAWWATDAGLRVGHSWCRHRYKATACIREYSCLTHGHRQVLQTLQKESSDEWCQNWESSSLSFFKYMPWSISSLSGNSWLLWCLISISISLLAWNCQGRYFPPCGLFSKANHGIIHETLMTVLLDEIHHLIRFLSISSVTSNCRAVFKCFPLHLLCFDNQNCCSFIMADYIHLRIPFSDAK